MANFRMILLGTERSETDDHELECFLNIHNEIFINISEPDHYDNFICLDKSTALILKEILDEEIKKMQEEE